MNTTSHKINYTLLLNLHLDACVCVSANRWGLSEVCDGIHQVLHIDCVAVM